MLEETVTGEESEFVTVLRVSLELVLGVKVSVELEPPEILSVVPLSSLLLT